MGYVELIGVCLCLLTMLNDSKIRSAKPRERAFKLYDERGLFLLVTPTGGRLWRLKYELHGHEKLISLGAYPDVTLQRARDRREAARKLICDDIDPSDQRKAERAVLAQTFQGVANEWLELQKKSLAPETIWHSRWRRICCIHTALVVSEPSL